MAERLTLAGLPEGVFLKVRTSVLCVFPGYHAVRGVLRGSAAVEAVPSHVLLGADVVLHVQEELQDGLLLRRPAQQGKLLVQGGPLVLPSVFMWQMLLGFSSLSFSLHIQLKK